VRALHPHIGARIALEGEGRFLGVHRAAQATPALVPATLEPGMLRAIDTRLVFGTARGALELLEVQPPGGRAMEGGAYIRGHPVARA
jgi:methionyl-tRNA formyltransferase